MNKRRPNPRLAKIHRNYTVNEIATLYSIHRNTVRAWIKRGLPTVDEKRPALILGRELVVFLQARRQRNKRTCAPGEIYCVRCREPRTPAGEMADCVALTDTLGTLIGICPICECIIYRRVNLAKLAQVQGKLDVSIMKAPPHIDDTAQPFANSYLSEQPRDHDKAQC